MFAGYASRLLIEMKKIYKENALSNVANKEIKININILDSARRKYSVFTGASVLATEFNKPDYKRYWISKGEWEESGAKIIPEKCKTLIR